MEALLDDQETIESGVLRSRRTRRSQDEAFDLRRELSLWFSGQLAGAAV
jgi:hypothetical protein